ncbi:MAG TPA: penicillin acylase family protein, partial [bacterium]|nr:penicillin acylase family protein [bacterium]
MALPSATKWNLTRRLLRGTASRIWKPYRLPHEGRLALEGPISEISITWDPHGIPHVFAQSESDLYFGLGFLHAGERLWQMDYLRRINSGRLAEILGDRPLDWQLTSIRFSDKGVLDLDFFMRTLGLRRAAEASLAILAPEVTRLLESYCQGVNRSLEIQHRSLPLEFRLLGYSPDPWTPLDILLLQKGMAQLLSLSWRVILALSLIAEKLPTAPRKLEMLQALGPWEEEGGSQVLRKDLEDPLALSRAVANLMGSGASGSNAWAVSGVHTRTGYPLLACDPHLPLGSPSTWYLAHLKGGGIDVMGATLPGGPGVIVGRNRTIAWGVTNLMAHDADLYLERLHPLRADLYRVGDHWERFEITPEVIGIRGKPAVLKYVRRGRHGPVLSDLPASAGQAPMAVTLRWTAEEPSREPLAIMLSNRARNCREFIDAWREFAGPALNIVYADTEGNIGSQVVGKIPIRARGHGTTLLPGWTEDFEWTGYLPYEKLPHRLNPSDGILVSANSKESCEGFPDYISAYWEPSFRYRRIRELLQALRPASTETFRAIQSDTFCLQARDLISQVLQPWGNRVQNDLSMPERNALSALLHWPGDSSSSSREAALFHVFCQKILERAFSAIPGELLPCHYTENWNLPALFVEHLLRQPKSPWWEGKDWDRELLQAFRCARKELSLLGTGVWVRSWGKIHRLLFRHPLGENPVLGSLLNEGPLPGGGCGLTVNSGYYSFASPYAQKAGASYRQIIDLSPTDESCFILPLGQSGNSLLPHHHDLLPFWS